MGLFDSTLHKLGFVRANERPVTKAGIDQSQQSNWDALFGATSSAPFSTFNSLRQQMAAYTDWVYTAANKVATECATIDITLYLNRTSSTNSTLSHKLIYSPAIARKYMQKRVPEITTKNGKVTVKASVPSLEEVESHPVLDLLNKPNPFMTRDEFFEMTFLHLELTGDAFWAIIRGKGGKPAELWPMMPNLVKVIPDAEKFISGYTYTVGGNQVPFETQDVVHHKYSNPNDFRRGMSTVMAAARAIDTDAQAADYNRKFFYNSAQPDAVLQTAEVLDDQTFKRVKDQFNDLYGGTANAHRTAVLENGLEYKAMNLTQKEMDFLKSREFNRDMILAMFHVPKSIIGLDGTIARAQAETGEYVFIKGTIRPKMQRLVNHITQDLAAQFDPRLVVSFTDPVPEDKEFLLKERDSMVNNILTANEVREDMGLEGVEGGDQLFIAGTMIPLHLAAAAAEANAEANKPDPEADKPDPNDDQGEDKPAGDGNEGGDGSDDGGHPPAGDNPAPESDQSAKAVAKANHTKMPEGTKSCLCCNGVGEHYTTGYECYRCDASGYVSDAEETQPIPCGGREDSDDLWIDDDGNFRHAEERGKGLAKGGIIDSSTLTLVGDEPGAPGFIVPTAKKKDSADQPELDWMRTKDYEDVRNRVADKFVSGFMKGVLKHVRIQEKEVLANVSKRFKSAKQLKASKRVIKANVNNLFNPQDSAKGWQAVLSIVFQPLIEQMGEASNKFLEEQLGIDLPPYNVFDPEVKRFYTERIRRISVYFDQETQKQLGATLMEGIDLGESVDELRNRVHSIYAPGNLMGYRAERIARTEPIFGTTWATLDSWEKSGVVKAKEWKTAPEAVPAKNNPCPFCRAMNGQRIESMQASWYDLGDSMHAEDDEGNDVSMTFNYVPVVGPPLHPNCRCVLIPIIE